MSEVYILVPSQVSPVPFVAGVLNESKIESENPAYLNTFVEA